MPNQFKHLEGQIDHKSKDCELRQSEQVSYLAIPSPGEDIDERVANALACPVEELPASNELGDEELPEGLLRVTSRVKGDASSALHLFKEDEWLTLRRVFEILQKGRSALEPPGPLAIADLNSNLLRFRNQEYEGLDALASHLQTLFGECECSIFRAHPVKADDNDEVHLYLAATTALSENPQHKMFRETFFRDREHYTCFDDPAQRGDERHWHKTQRAYYQPSEPVHEQVSKGKGGFGGRGEWKESTSYLALAIPSRELNGRPYGVIRLVRGSIDQASRGSQAPFTEEEKTLASTIAKTLTFWLDLFPRNDELRISWADENLKLVTLRNLFTNSDHKAESSINKLEIEFGALLRKLYTTNKAIKIVKKFAGYSGAAVLLVESDSEQTTILKCASKIRGNPADPIIHKNLVRLSHFLGAFCERRVNKNEPSRRFGL